MQKSSAKAKKKKSVVDCTNSKDRKRDGISTCIVHPSLPHVNDTFSHDLYKTFRPGDHFFKNVTSLTENNATHKVKVWRVCGAVVFVLCNASVCALMYWFH